MKVRLESEKDYTIISKETFPLYENREVLVSLEEGIGCIKTKSEAGIIKSSVVGFDGDYYYHYFIFDIARQNNKKSFVEDGINYIYLLSGEAPLKVDKNILKDLEIFKKPGVNKVDKKDIDYNLIASSYYRRHSFKRYNDDYYFFHPLKFRWQTLRNYDDYNILISLENRNYVRRDKTQIMDSLQIYLDELTNISIDKDLLLFENNKVLNIMTREVTDFDGSQFILKSINANWYEDEKDIPNKDFYLTKVLNDLCNINDYSKEADHQRKKDLIIYLGYMLTEMQKQNGLVLFGKAQNGKSTVARLISIIKGSSFNIEVNNLVNDGFYMSGFYNERILFIDELKPKMVTEEFVSKFNKLLGNTHHSVRPMQKEPRTVYTNFTAIITANEVSPQFFTNRALLRRIKIMNSMFPVVTNLPPNINLDDELQKSHNKDWLTNIAIRSFMDNNYSIDNLFTEDIKWWIGTNNDIAERFVKLLVSDGLIDDEYEIIDKDDYYSVVAQYDNLYQDLGIKKAALNDKKTGDEYRMYIDEQINIAFMYILFTPELSCREGKVIYRQ